MAAVILGTTQGEVSYGHKQVGWVAINSNEFFFLFYKDMAAYINRFVEYTYISPKVASRVSLLISNLPSIGCRYSDAFFPDKNSYIETDIPGKFFMKNFGWFDPIYLESVGCFTRVKSKIKPRNTFGTVVEEVPSGFLYLSNVHHPLIDMISQRYQGSCVVWTVTQTLTDAQLNFIQSYTDSGWHTIQDGQDIYVFFFKKRPPQIVYHRNVVGFTQLWS